MSLIQERNMSFMSSLIWPWYAWLTLCLNNSCIINVCGIFRKIYAVSFHNERKISSVIQFVEWTCMRYVSHYFVYSYLHKTLSYVINVCFIYETLHYDIYVHVRMVMLLSELLLGTTVIIYYYTNTVWLVMVVNMCHDIMRCAPVCVSESVVKSNDWINDY